MKKENESVKKLEVGKDYVNAHDNDVVVIDRLSDILNKGFEHLVYKNYMSCSDTSNWREATESEVVEAFEKHLVYRYGEDWKTMKIKEKHPNSNRGINGSSYEMLILKLRHNGWVVYNQNGMLYCNGIWVERLEEPKIHIKEAIKANTVVHCETEEEAERILGMAHELGYKWHTGENYENYTEWNIYKSAMCYYLFDGSYSDCGYFKKNDYTITPSTLIADLKIKETDWTTPPKDFEYKKIKISSNANKKRYEVIKTIFSDFKQLSLGDNKTNKIVAHFVEQDEETALLAEKIADILNLMEK